MKRMIWAIFIFFVLVSVFIIGYAVLADPLNLIADTLVEADDETGAEIEDTMNVIKFSLGAATVVGIGLTCVLLIAFGHKKEYE